MNVNLTPELEKLVHEKVESGLYNNQSEVVREALRLLEAQERLRESHLKKLQTALMKGLAEADRGELRNGEEVIQEFREFLANRRESKTKD